MELLMPENNATTTQLTARLTVPTFVEMVSSNLLLVKLVITDEALLTETATLAQMPAVLLAERPDVVTESLTLSTANNAITELKTQTLQMLADSTVKILSVVMVLKTMVNNVMTEIRLTMTDALAADLIVVMVLLTLVSNVTTELPTMTSTQTDAVPTA
jgi:acyl-CoA thioesterase